MSQMKKQTQKWIESSETQSELLSTLVAYTDAAQEKSPTPAKHQLLALDAIVKIANENGRPQGGLSLGDTILDQQYHKIGQYGAKAFALSEKQMNVIVRENWNYIK